MAGSERSPSYRESGRRLSEEPSGYDRRHSGSSWEMTRKIALKRAGGRCQDCGTGDKPLQVHHVEPVHQHDNPDVAHRSQNVVAVCPDCHRRRENQ